MTLIPKYLFRGDADPLNKRKLKETYKSGLLLTNLCNGGNGREIFNNSLESLVNKHIAVGWDKTHFLTFSTNENTAFLYGSNGREYFELYDDFEQWDFTVITFDTSQLISDSIHRIADGIYKAEFFPTCKEFLPSYKVILIDTLTHLISISTKNNLDFSTAIEKARTDGEWLILPASPFGNNGEFTAKFDTACISDKRIFRYE